MTPTPAEPTSPLTLEQYVSVAEHTLDEAGLSGPLWSELPGPTEYPKRYENPEYWAALAPITDWTNAVLAGRGHAHPIKVISDGWEVTQGRVQAATDGANWIDVQTPVTTLTLLHEVAHCLRGTGEGAGHDVEFARTLRSLLTEHVSVAAADQFWLVVATHRDVREGRG